MKKTLKSQSGFTLIEFVIVLVILSLLAYIAFPNLLRTYMSENEKSIKIALRTFNGANEAYRKSQIPPNYASTIQELITPKASPSFLDSSWKSTERHGFNLTYSGGGKEKPESYSLLAVPTLQNRTAKNSYCIDPKGALITSIDAAVPLSASADGCAGGSPVVG